MCYPSNISKEIGTYIVLTFALSSVFYVPMISSGEIGGAVERLMWCPGIAALITCLVYQRNIRGFGWGCGKIRYHLLSYGLPLVYGFMIYEVVWLSKLGRINESFSTDDLTFIISRTSHSCILALGEEIGWRGFLVPRLAKLTNFLNTSLISGIIWAVWHYPGILFADYHSRAPVWYGLSCFTIAVVGMSFAFSWIRLKSGSLWTAMFLHASHNLYIQGFFDPLTEDTGITRFIIGEFGAALAVVSVIIAYIFWRLRSRLPDTRLDLETEGSR